MTSQTEDTTLSDKMRKLKHSRSTELVLAADKLDAAIASLDPIKVIGAWARARRLWSECTGEDLI